MEKYLLHITQEKKKFLSFLALCLHGNSEEIYLTSQNMNIQNTSH